MLCCSACEHFTILQASGGRESYDVLLLMEHWVRKAMRTEVERLLWGGNARVLLLFLWVNNGFIFGKHQRDEQVFYYFSISDDTFLPAVSFHLYLYSLAGY